MKSKIINFLKIYKLYIICLIITTFLVSLIYIIKGVTPFGKNSLLIIDFYHQYGPLFGELYDRIINKLNVLYSFNLSLGLPFFRNFLNCLSSPFSIIIFLFNKTQLITSLSLIIGLKIIFSCATMTYYLSKKINTKNIYLVLFGLLYAFSSYFIAYYWNIMYLDGLVFFPLIILGIERLIDENNYMLYIVSLLTMIVANYYIAYMISIFSCLYFLAYYALKTLSFNVKYFLKYLGKFIMYSFIAAGIAGLFLIPLIYSFHSISATGSSWPTSQYYLFSLKEFIIGLFSNVKYTIFASGITNAPNIGCGVLILYLSILFFANPKIKLKEKIIYLSILAILTLSFAIAQVDYVWHGFHVPNDVPYRYSFIYSFILIVLATISLFKIKYVKYIYILGNYIVISVIAIIIYLTKNINFSDNTLIINLVLLSLYFLFITIYVYYPKLKKIIFILFLITVSGEIFININKNWTYLYEKNQFYDQYDVITKTLNKIKENNKSMYRIEQVYFNSYNDPSWYNYYGQMGFSSMIYENLAYLEYSLGMPSNEINSFNYKQTTPIHDLMFNIKYFIGDNFDNLNYELYFENEYLTVNKNNYNVGLMFGVNKDILNWNYDLENPFLIQNDFIDKATGIKDILYKLKVANEIVAFQSDDEIIIKYEIDNINKNMYIYNNDYNVNYFIIDNVLYQKYDDEDITIIEKNLDIEIKEIKDYEDKYVISSIPKERTTIYVSYNNYEKNSLLVYSLDNNKLKEAYNILNSNAFKIADFKENHIKGNINIDKEMVLYTSIPYDQGWEVYIDGKKVNTYAIGNALLGFNISKGNHQVELKYYPKGLNLGIAISIISTLTLTVYYVINRKKYNKERILN